MSVYYSSRKLVALACLVSRHKQCFKNNLDVRQYFKIGRLIINIGMLSLEKKKKGRSGETGPIFLQGNTWLELNCGYPF